MITIAFAGNPNVGKTALINAIAGSNLKVGNWPGVTVEKKEAIFSHNGEDIKLIDLPGVYSLSPYTIEEIVTRDFIINEKPDVIINVVDSTNLERNLYLTLLLKELGKPMIMALNFFDEFTKLNYKLDMKNFSQLIGMDIVKTSAIKKIGLDELLNKAILLSKKSSTYNYDLHFDKDIDQKIDDVKSIIKSSTELTNSLNKFDNNFLAIKLLEKDSNVLEILEKEYKYTVKDNNEISNISTEIEKKYDDDIETIFAQARYGVVNGILAKTFTSSMKSRLELTDKIDKILLNRILGLPIFFLILIILMTFVFNGSAPLIDWIDGFVNNFIGKYVAEALGNDVPPVLSAFLVDGIIGGVGGVIVFVPLMLFLYFFLAILEESGYMSRVAFVMDKLMNSLGLNGKAFVPMILGFGCTVPAIYATRTLEDKGSRRLTAAMAPFMSCGARLPVYGLFAGAFFGKNAAWAVITIYLVGIFIAILTGIILKRYKPFQSEHKALLIELPPYRIPSIKVILKSTFTRTGSYLKKASTVILGILILLWGLTYFPNNGDASKSYMAKFGQTLQPIMKPTGFATTWEPVAAIVPSIAAKEVVVGFMAQVLPEENGTKAEATETEEKTTFSQDAIEQFKGLGSAIKDSIVSMISFNVSELFAPPSTEEIDADNSGVVERTKHLWDNNDNLAPLRAFSFMVFILLVVPCVVTLAAIKQEFGSKFMFFIIGLLMIIPYVVSTLVFQIGRLFI